MSLPTDGSGRNGIKFVAPGTIRVTTDDATRVDINKENMTVNADLDAMGGYHVPFQFYAGKVAQGAKGQMTGSVVVLTSTFAAVGSHTVATRYPMVRNGSVVGMALWSPDSIMLQAGLTASITVDGANVTGANLIMLTGSNKATTFTKDSYTFSASQQVGVSFTASAGYESSLALSGSWVCTVLVEF
jgi:hypothetical protein